MVSGVADIPDLSGRVAVFTGANSGLGLQAATVLAAKGAHVWLAAHDEVGHWALTAHLMPALLAAPAARVVTVTSFARLMGQPLEPTNPHLDGSYTTPPGPTTGQ